MIRILLFLLAVAACIAGLIVMARSMKQKRLEPGKGAGTNILEAAEKEVDAGESLQINQETGLPVDPSGESEFPAANDKDSVTLCMVGDVILHQRVLDSAVTEGGYDFSNLFANVTQEIRKYDIKIANQETMMGGSAFGYCGYPAFNSPFEEADALVDAGFNVVLHASNHALDKGQEAVQNCLNYWNNNHPDIAVLGIHDENEPSRDMFVYEKNGIRIAVLNYAYGSNQYQEELSGVLTGELNLLELEHVEADIASAKEQADYIVVCPHWGEEDTTELSDEQLMWSQYFLEWGVDLVIGTHPHVIQPIQKMVRADGHEMLVYYSLGNFLSNQNDRYGNVGAMAQVVIGRSDSGEVRTEDYGVRTLVCHESYDGEAYTSYFLDEYPEELAETNEVKATDPEFSYSYCWELRDQVFGDVGSIRID